jgi:hypothetical protein
MVGTPGRFFNFRQNQEQIVFSLQLSIKMQGLGITIISQKIAEFLGLPPLVIEVGFLVLVSAFIFCVVLVTGAVIRIAKEMIKFNIGVDYVSSMLTREVEEAKVESGQFDFNPGEWREDTREKVLKMLQEGKTQAEIISTLEVSESYIKGVKRWAFEEGSLFKKIK